MKLCTVHVDEDTANTAINALFPMIILTISVAVGNKIYWVCCIDNDKVKCMTTTQPAALSKKERLHRCRLLTLLGACAAMVVVNVCRSLLYP
jgi:hypothetical protein